MATSAVLRVILGENSSQRVVLPLGLPDTVTELENEIRRQCQLQDLFRLQFMDELFGNIFQDLTSMEEIQDRATVKVLSLRPVVAGSCDNGSLTPTHVPNHAGEPSSVSPADTTVMLSSQESVSPRSSWPEVFHIPRFTYDAELKLEQANQVYREEGTRLIPDPKLRSDILQGLNQEIVQYKVYFADMDAEKIAKALIQKHPCLTEVASETGYSGWVRSIKNKLSNYRTILRKMGCREMADAVLPFLLRSQRGEVAYCPSFPSGEDDDSLENIRVELLSDIKKRNNRETVKMKMQRTFALRRHKVIGCDPMISDFTMRWPALFDVTEINAEFKRITTIPLQSKFLSQLDLYSANLLKMFESTTGQKGKKLKALTNNMDTDDIDAGRDLLIKGLCLYLNEDPGDLVQEFIDVDETIVEGAIEKTTMGIFTLKNTASEDDVRIVLEGVTVIQYLETVAFASAMLLD
ncbi:hypothetical protein F7725_021454 [Dissostichus mawsoni]|uniref:Uncharacterized protein n=1 Tax=Dissostichus mawsoni TaxID=36200 RepID=A0A7J5ZB92_DISMA|nr:hypothetical protein F7725_021454 [Dissostichus mawsoni]